MCVVTCDGSCRSSSSSGVGEVFGMIGSVVVFVAELSAVVLAKVVFPVAVKTAIVAGRFVAGAALLPRSRGRRLESGASYLRGGAKHATVRLSVHWYAWPGWQRSLARLAAVTVLVALWQATLATAVLLTAVCAVIVALAVRSRLQRRASGPRRVRVLTGESRARALASKVAGIRRYRRRAVTGVSAEVVPVQLSDMEKVHVR